MRRLLPALLLALLCASCARQEASRGRRSTHMLEPAALQAVALILDRAQPTLHRIDVGIEHERVLARLCHDPDGEGECFRVYLEHHSAGCQHGPWGEFCVRFPDAEPPATDLVALTTALRSSAGMQIWTPIPPSEIRDPIEQSDEALLTAESHTVDPRVPLRALALIMVSVAIGTVVGAPARWLLGRRCRGGLPAVTFLLVPSLLLFVLNNVLQLVGVWDALCMGWLAGCGFLLVLHRACADRRNVVLAIAACLVALVAAEGASRQFLPRPPAFPSATGPSLLIAEALQTARSTGMATTQAGLDACQAIYGKDAAQRPPASLELPAAWKPRADARQRVLHLGDSMVFGYNEERFTDQLGRLEPEAQHVNASIPGTGPDVYLALLRRYTDLGDFTVVVMHLTPNDFTDLDQPHYPCSGGASLLVYDGATAPRLRFERPYPWDQEQGALWLVLHSPPPYVLRASVDFSSFGSHLAALWVKTVGTLGGTITSTTDDVRVAHLTAILQAARSELSAQRIALVVNLFPDREDVEGNELHQNSSRPRIVQSLASVGIPYMDSTTVLRQLVQSGISPYLSATDMHFNGHGHRQIADWLHAELPAAIQRATAFPGP